MKTYKYRVYPTESQKTLLFKTVGCCRFVWNHFLALHEDAYKAGKKPLSKFDAIKQLKPLKKEENTAFLREVDSSALRISIERQYAAWNAFSKRRKAALKDGENLISRARSVNIQSHTPRKWSMITSR